MARGVSFVGIPRAVALFYLLFKLKSKKSENSIDIRPYCVI